MAEQWVEQRLSLAVQWQLLLMSKVILTQIIWF